MERGNHPKQAEVTNEEIYNEPSLTGEDFSMENVYKLRLERLQTLYEDDDPRALNLLERRHSIVIDENYLLRVGTGQINIDTKKTMLDYHLTVANCIGLSPLLPNTMNSHNFLLQMDLQKPYREFKGKKGMVGIDTKGKMLYIGQANNEDIFIAMAPNEFLQRRTNTQSASGRPTGTSKMTTRHYRQIVMMFAHFLEKIHDRAFFNIHSVYSQNLENEKPNWDKTTNIL